MYTKSVEKFTVGINKQRRVILSDLNRGIKINQNCKCKETTDVTFIAISSKSLFLGFVF